MNELTRIKKALAVYKSVNTHGVQSRKWREAHAYLCKVHDTYGTVDVGVIRSLTR